MPKLLDVHGETAITYTVKLGGTTYQRRAIFTAREGVGEERNAVFVMSTNATTGIADPRRGDTITFGQNLWQVKDVVHGKDGGVELFCTTYADPPREA